FTFVSKPGDKEEGKEELGKEEEGEEEKEVDDSRSEKSSSSLWMGNFDGRFYEITCNPTTPPEVTVETLAPKEGDADDDDLRVRVGVSGPNVTPFMLSSSLIKVIVSFTAFAPIHHDRSLGMGSPVHYGKQVHVDSPSVLSQDALLVPDEVAYVSNRQHISDSDKPMSIQMSKPGLTVRPFNEGEAKAEYIESRAGGKFTKVECEKQEQKKKMRHGHRKFRDECEKEDRFGFDHGGLMGSRSSLLNRSHFDNTSVMPAGALERATSQGQPLCDVVSYRYVSPVKHCCIVTFDPSNCVDGHVHAEIAIPKSCLSSSGNGYCCVTCFCGSRSTRKLVSLSCGSNPLWTDVSLKYAYTPESELVLRRGVALLAKDHSHTLTDVLSARVRCLKSVKDAWELSTRTCQNSDHKLLKYSEFSKFCDMSEDEQLKLYRRYPCHETNLFLCLHCPAFAQKYILPILSTKLDKDINSDHKLLKYSEFSKFCDMSEDEQLKLYRRYPCHETNLFLCLHCPAFAQKYILPILSTKLDKDIVDMWLCARAPAFHVHCGEAVPSEEHKERESAIKSAICTSLKGSAAGFAPYLNYNMFLKLPFFEQFLVADWAHCYLHFLGKSNALLELSKRCGEGTAVGMVGIMHALMPMLIGRTRDTVFKNREDESKKIGKLYDTVLKGAEFEVKPPTPPPPPPTLQSLLRDRREESMFDDIPLEIRSIRQNISQNMEMCFDKCIATADLKKSASFFSSSKKKSKKSRKRDYSRSKMAPSSFASMPSASSSSSSMRMSSIMPSKPAPRAPAPEKHYKKLGVTRMYSETRWYESGSMGSSFINCQFTPNHFWLDLLERSFHSHGSFVFNPLPSERFLSLLIIGQWRVSFLGLAFCGLFCGEGDVHQETLERGAIFRSGVHCGLVVSEEVADSRKSEGSKKESRDTSESSEPSESI
ncbi:hypothetical protein ADUPG1_000585, partial [Aduncisulcus paluster]